MRIVSIVALFFLLSGCLKEEIPVSRPDQGEIKSAVAEMESDYRYQVYFSLETDSFVGRNMKSAWDLGFECADSGYRVILNTSKLMFAAWTKSNEDVSDTNQNVTWKMDGITGSMDSTAIGDWRSKSSYLLIDRGLDEKGNHLGFVKLRILSKDIDAYEIEWAELKSVDWNNMRIPVNTARNFTHLSFDQGGQTIDIEPNKSEWDLLFTQYSERLWDGSVFLPYLVTGVQINRSETEIAEVRDVDFDAIALDRVGQMDFTSRIDRPGYKWKEYQFDEGFYEIIPGFSYVIKSSKGFYYKLRFVDFYNDSGERGFPKFEYQRL